MNITSLINKKRLKQALNQNEINFIIDSYMTNKISDAQMSALLMAININGMNDEETFYLTEAMLKSGDIVDLKGIDTVDKHSTGGVGDKITLIVAPIVSALGINVAKMSGKSLGHTGGTIDKLSSIPGFKTELSEEEFIKQIKDINVAITAQTKTLAPADKKIYALRDETSTVESIPLIASSIMSKKLASGADKMVFDIKVGEGAFMKNIIDAKALAHIMIEIGKRAGKEVICVLTNMEEPLGNNIGNALEVIESMEFLKGKDIPDLKEVVISIASAMVSLGKGISFTEAEKEVLEVLENGKAYEKFLELIKYQGGKIEQLKVADKVISLKSSCTGFISDIDAVCLGLLERKLSKNGNLGTGFVLNKKTGDYVIESEELMKIYYDDENISLEEASKAFIITPSFGKDTKKVYEIIK